MSDAANAEVVFKGKMFEIVHDQQPDGRVFERAVRAPGVRLIIADQVGNKVLLTREHRSELSGWDYRLPGGKVFDSLEEFDTFRTSTGDIAKAAEHKGVAEAREEAGIAIAALRLFKKSTLGATVEWDLWVFEATQWAMAAGGQQLEAGERIEADNWFDYDEARRMILDGQMQEERIALLLLQWLQKQH